MMKKIFVLILGALLLTPVIAFSKMESCDDTVKGPMVMKTDAQCDPNLLKFKKDLSLTEVQVNQIKELRTGLEKTVVKIQSDIKAINSDVKTIYQQKIVNFNAAREKIQQLSKIQSQIALEMVNTFEKSYSILSDQQKDILSKLMSEDKSGK